MTRPVFLSMGGKSDTKLAKKVKELLPDPMVYFYQHSGEEGVEFRPEIEAEINGCRLFVLFWSEEYFKSEHAKTELAMFKRLVAEGAAKDILVVPTKRKFPNIQGTWKNPLSSREEYILDRWRYERAVYESGDPTRIAENIRRKLEKAQIINRAMVPRPHLLAEIKKSLARPNFQTVQFALVSGYEGDGRRTAIRQHMESAHINLTPRYVPLDTTEGPEDLLLRILNNSNHSRRREILEGVKKKGTHAKAIRTLLFESVESKNYYVIVLNRFTASDSGSLPSWLSDVFGNIGNGNAPIAFLVVPNPVTDSQKQYYPYAARIRIAGLDELEMDELVHKLVAEDKDPRRWTEDKMRIVVKISGSSPSLCQAIMYAMSTEPNLDFLDRIAQREAEIFSANISALVGYLVQQFKDRPGDILALRIVERLGIVSKRTLDEIFEIQGNIHPYDLYQLHEFGLIERLLDDTYRIPPLVQRRLGDALWASEIHKNIDDLLLAFAKQMSFDEEDLSSVYASNKVTTQLRTLTSIPKNLELYVTTGTLFKTGLERYSKNEFDAAYTILQRAMRRLLEGAEIDSITQIEIARYYGLSAARQGQNNDVQIACDFLRGGNFQSRSSQAEAIALFLTGFQFRMEGRSREAVVNFEGAREKLRNIKFAERQRGAILTELSRAYLRLNPPQYDKAVATAQEAYDQTKVVHNLSGLIRAKISRFSAYQIGSPQQQDDESNIRDLIALLTEMCQRSNQDFHLAREADLERVLAFKRKQSGDSKIIDLTKAIQLNTAALAIKRMDQTKSEIWVLKLFDQMHDHVDELITETTVALESEGEQDKTFLRNAAVVKIIATSRKNQGGARGLLRKYMRLMDDYYRRLVNRIIDEKGAVGESMEDYLSLDRI